MLTVAEFKNRYGISDATFKRARKAAEEKLGRPVTQRMSSKTWRVLDESAIIAELSEDAKARGFQSLMTNENLLEVEFVDSVDSVSSALAVRNESTTLALKSAKPIETSIQTVKFDHAIEQVNQARSDMNQGLNVAGQQLKNTIKQAMMPYALAAMKEVFEDATSIALGK